MTKKKFKYNAAELNDHDRKVLSKYTGFYSNFIESNTAENPLLKDENYNGKPNKS